MKSKKDPNQIAQHEHDESSGSKKVKIIDTDLSIELDADDGDSVQTQARCMSIELEEGMELDISSYSKIKLYIQSKTSETGSITVQISPEKEGNFWMNSHIHIVLTGSTGASLSSDDHYVMAMRARIVDTLGNKVIAILKGV
ncbi:MAG: hypothetical protein COB41_00410 [Proteobacteria bacterium]|nr:MAG: hypothetical protein COB41_00410 [Pseudomonadota bacterium]